MRYLTVVGALRTRCVGLVTRDPVLYADLAAMLRERRIPAVSVVPGERIPERVAVVLTSAAEAPTIRHPRVLAVPSNLHRESLLAAVAGAFEHPDQGGEIVVGIDPGPRPGYAVLSDGSVLVEGSLDAPESVVDLGRHLHRRFPDRPIRFRVGSGDHNSGTRIVNALWNLKRPIELVDESGTTPRGHRRPRDAVAARRIAGHSGRPVAGPSALRITRGEIANLQRLSRESSNGELTISRTLATRVLGGELTLPQAIEAGRRRGIRAAAGTPTRPTEPL